MTGVLKDKGRTSTVRLPCMCVMQAAAVLRMVRLANFPDALQQYQSLPLAPTLQQLHSMLRCCSRKLQQDPVHAPIAC